ncbi:P-loop containing nucleoside triphosphate hydrolase protein [Crassisporium funariophilum]|nr:P-loop containing nucleoside triphosphate hydrolase protein [Crassisporium funariophilum]
MFAENVPSFFANCKTSSPTVGFYVKQTAIMSSIDLRRPEGPTKTATSPWTKSFKYWFFSLSHIQTFNIDFVTVLPHSFYSSLQPQVRIMLKVKESQTFRGKHHDRHKEDAKDGVLKDGSSRDIVIPVMGPAGAGKSTFINAFLGDERMRVGHHLTSCTAQLEYGIVPCDPQRYPGLAGYRVIIVDTPGFNDTYEGDAEILRRIAVWLEKSYRQRMVLGGVIYLHDISHDRFSGTARRNLEMFHYLCGDAALRKVVLGSTRWGDVSPIVATRREQELKETHWKFMMEKGSEVRRFLGDRQSARILVDAVLHRLALGTALEIQTELAIEQKIIPETKAGQELRYTLQEALVVQKRIVKFETAMAERGDEEAKAAVEETRARMHKITKDIQDLKTPRSQRFLAIIGL